MAVVTRAIAAGSDDAREGVGTAPVITDGSLIGNGVGDHIGLRFTNLTIPKGAAIVSAVLAVALTDSSKNDAEGTWYGQAQDNPGTFTTTDGNIDGRAKTTASVAWTTNDLGNANATVSPPDLKAIVQEIVNRAGWVSGNAFVLLYAHNSSTDRLAFAGFEDTRTEPTLTITYVPPISDTATVGITEVASVVITTSRTDAVAVSVADVIALALTLTRPDAVALAVDDVAVLALTLTRPDALAVAVVDALEVLSSLDVLDSVAIATTEEASAAGDVGVTDSPAVALAEAIVALIPRAVADTAATGVTDVVDVGSDLTTKTMTDGAAVGVSESTLAMLAVLDRAEAVGLSVADVAAALGALAASDGVIVEVVEERNRLVQIDVPDALYIFIAEALTDIVKTSIFAKVQPQRVASDQNTSVRLQVSRGANEVASDQSTQVELVEAPQDDTEIAADQSTSTEARNT